MTTTLREILSLLDATLEPWRFQDYCPNGLQVEGRGHVRRVVSGVTASAALIDAAIDRGADALLVHHGYFWKGEDPRITGMKRARLNKLLAHDISLIAYHLPLDAHPELGNNAQLARELGLVIDGPLDPANPRVPGNTATLATPVSVADFATHVGRILGRTPQVIPGGPEKIRRVGWCTGAAQGYIEQAIAHGLDAFLSGEISEPTVHAAREAGITYLACGHHATERYGARALGEFLQARLGVPVEFVDIDNPV
ncbi:MAG TPA: Nif3-like dinuclear metal center hexameric protein [Moraxellaceae bacterium]|nr:Nif3-like dinuclear metal center hexameric protein [Moraxellaceae bacterium]